MQTDRGIPEDFRWPSALAGFLGHISGMGADRVDLVILGDFLEMWQPPDNVTCKGPSEELGCTVAEMQQIVTAIVQAHPQGIRSTTRFLANG